MHIWESQINTSVPLDHRTTTIAQIFYAISIVSVTGTVLASPWISPIYSTEAAEPVPSSGPNPKRAIHLRGINNSVFVTGLTYTVLVPSAVATATARQSNSCFANSLANNLEYSTFFSR